MAAAKSSTSLGVDQKNIVKEHLSIDKLKTIEIKGANEGSSCLNLSTNINGNILVGTENGAYFLSNDGQVVSTFLVSEDGDFNEIPSVEFCPDTPNIIYLATGSTILSFDTRMTSSNSLENDSVITFNDNTDEINQLSIANKHLAACDDSGEIRIYDLTAKRNFRTLRRKHKNICSSVCFRPQYQNELFSGGLDCQVFLWNYSKIRTLSSSNAQNVFSANENKSVYMMCPPMINDIDCIENGMTLGCGIGNGSVLLYEITKERKLNVVDILNEHSSLGVSCVKLFTFKNQAYLLSGGNDCKINLWQYPSDDCSVRIKFSEIVHRHGNIEMMSKVSSVAPILNNSNLCFIACEQSNKLSYFSVKDGTS